MLDILLQYGAIPTTKNSGGWLPFHEAIATGTYRGSLKLYTATQQRFTSEFCKRAQRLSHELDNIPNFYMEVKWSFTSWVPLISRFCPNDTYKIWKKGNAIRIDSSLIGFENMSWLKGRITYLFTPRSHSRPAELVILNHDKNLLQWSSESLAGDSERIEKEVKMQMAMELQKSKMSAEKIEFRPSLTWWGNVKVEKVGEWDCHVYSTGNVIIRTTTRKNKEDGEKKQGMRRNKLGAEEKYLSYHQYFNSNLTQMKGMVWDSETVSEKTREFCGTVWLSEHFPITLDQFLPILEIAAPSGKHCQKLKQFLEVKMPLNEFPIKIDIPAFPTITATAQFVRYEEWGEREVGDLFVVPQYEVARDSRRGVV
jgi:ankyrin repeat domain-containing protein 13